MAARFVLTIFGAIIIECFYLNFFLVWEYDTSKYHMCMYFVCFSRVAYLLSKNFSKVDIAQMVRNAPFLLSFSVERLDNRLGFFQKELELSVKKVKRRREFVCFHVSYI